MKKTVITTTLLVLALAGHVKAQMFDKALCERKIKTYRKVERIGLGLTIIGGVSTIIGVELVNKGGGGAAYATPVSPGSLQPVATHNNDNNFNTGMLCLTAGIPTLIAGIVLTTIGVPKVHNYKKKLAGLSLGLAPRGNGLSLTYRF